MVAQFSFVGNIIRTAQRLMLISYHLFQPMRSQEMVTKLNLSPQLSILHQEFTHLSIVQSQHLIMNQF